MPDALSQFLVEAGHDVETACRERLAGAKDPAILKAATREDRILMTLDLDFADIEPILPGATRGLWYSGSKINVGAPCVSRSNACLKKQISMPFEGLLPL